ncbi:MAG: nitroreductase family protein [Bacteroidales bacterium]|nr:nitroreductase family protein [Bacteroidales bacterium]
MKRILMISAIAAMVLASCSAPSETKNNDTETMEKVIMERRSIRNYQPQTISRDTLDRILKAGINAPNGQGRQAYEIRVVDNPELINAISEAVVSEDSTLARRDGKNIFLNAPVVVFLANDMSYDMSQVDCGLLGENIILLAQSMGIGSCCMAHPVRLMKNSKACEQYVSRLGISGGYNLLYAIVLGYPNENPDQRGRREDMIKWVE